MNNGFVKQAVELSMEVAEERHLGNGQCKCTGVLEGHVASPILSPAKKRLSEFLNSLGDDELRDLVALMYVGRGDSDSFQEMRDHVKDWDRNGCINKLMEKNPLFDYLNKGLAKC